MISQWPVLFALLFVGFICLYAVRHENRRTARLQQMTERDA